MTNCVVTSCNHRFQKGALLEWLLVEQTCPVDGKEIKFEDLKEDQETSKTAEELLKTCPEKRYVYHHDCISDYVWLISRGLSDEEEIAAIMATKAKQGQNIEEIINFHKDRIMREIGNVAGYIYLKSRKDHLLRLQGKKKDILFKDCEDALEVFNKQTVWPILKEQVKIIYGWNLADKPDRVFAKNNKLVLVFGENTSVSFQREERYRTHKDKLIIDGKCKNITFDDEPCIVAVQKAGSHFRLISVEIESFPPRFYCDQTGLGDHHFNTAHPLEHLRQIEL